MGRNQHRGRGQGGMRGRGGGCRRGWSAGASRQRTDSVPGDSLGTPPDAPAVQAEVRTETLADLKQQAEILEQQLAEVRSRNASAAPVVGSRVAMVNRARCTSCGRCVSACPREAIRMARCAEVDAALCSGCGACVEVCPVEAISLQPLES